MYDIVYIGANKNDPKFKTLKSRFPTLKYASSVEKASKLCFTKFFYIVWEDTIVCDSFMFDYIPDDWSQDYVHLFLNGTSYDGICLIPKKYAPSMRELTYRFFVKKKEVPIKASIPENNNFDVVFISYNEPNAENNWNDLLTKVPNAQRIHGVKGIHQAHIEAAKICKTDMFYVVDGDACVLNNFKFDYHVLAWEHDTVHVWRSKNPINDLEYGYGGVKLLPTDKTLNMKTNTADMTTSISSKFRVVEHTSNITTFNTDPFNTWKSAFRECAKLAAKVIDRQDTGETDERLKIWTTKGVEKPYGRYALAGARAGMEFGLNNSNDIKLINDFDWLTQQFESSKGLSVDS